MNSFEVMAKILGKTFPGAHVELMKLPTHQYICFKLRGQDSPDAQHIHFRSAQGMQKDLENLHKYRNLLKYHCTAEQRKIVQEAWRIHCVTSRLEG